MTTIAFDGRILAVDRAGWVGNGVQYETGKLARVLLTNFGEDGCGWYAGAGHAGDAIAIANWLIQGGNRPTMVDTQQSNGLIVTGEEQPRAFRISGALVLEPVLTIPWGDGAGMDMAIGAMAAGKTAPQAVEIVARHSTWAAIGMDYVDVRTGTMTRTMFR